MVKGMNSSRGRSIMKNFRRALIVGLCVAGWLTAGAVGRAAAQHPFSIEQILG
jgi:hypothetical protein